MSDAIRAEQLIKVYRRSSAGFKMRTLKSALLARSLTQGLDAAETIRALERVSFSVGRGEAFGVVGSNGSGKSTLLQLLAGILEPTSGRLLIDGRVAALIELGAGFHPEISGRENIFINGAILGMSRSEIQARYDDIVEFSGLAEHMEEPVKNYSSGMYVRLGFSVAIHIDPEILLVDEVLAVGDEAFAHKCLRRIEELLAEGRTVVMVSHALSLIEELCSRVLWLEDGRQKLIGEPRRVVDAYRLAVAEEESRQHREAKEEHERELDDGAAADGDEASPERWGSRLAEIRQVRLLDAQGEERYHFASGDSVTIELTVLTKTELDDFVFGVGISTPRGTECWGTNTDLAGYEPARLDGETKVRLVCPALHLAAGEYLVDVAVHAKDGAPYDYHRRHLSFSVTAPTASAGLYRPPHRWEFEGPVEWREEP